jgi:hypothetical protein
LFAQDVKKFSITDRPSLGKAAIELWSYASTLFFEHWAQNLRLPLPCEQPLPMVLQEALLSSLCVHGGHGFHVLVVHGGVEGGIKGGQLEPIWFNNLDRNLPVQTKFLKAM